MKIFFLMIPVFLLAVSGVRAEDAPTSNANSAFATNLLAQLRPDQYGYYDQVFTNLMEYEPPAADYAWKNEQASGRITSSARFTSPGGSLCRPYSESYTVEGKSQTRSGVACKRESGQGWCRLRENETYSCKLEPRGGIDGVLDNGTVRVNRWNNTVQRWKYKLNSLF